MQMPRDSFPTDWSPPPVEFLNKPKKAPPAKKGPLEDLEKDPPDPNQKVELASLEELFWNMASPSQQAGTPEISSGSSQCYINNLDYLLQEKRMLVEKFSVSLQVISPVHPGETVFLPRRHPLPCFLDSSRLKPHSPLEELFLRSSLPEQLSFLHNGLLSNLYLHAADCPQPLLQWLFQLLTWPPETSSRAFGLLWDLSIDGLFRQPDEDMHFWCPSLQEVKEVFSSLGAYNPALYPQGPFQHSASATRKQVTTLTCISKGVERVEVLDSGHTIRFLFLPSLNRQKRWLLWKDDHQRDERVLESEASLDSQDPPQEVALDIKLNYIYKFLTLCLLVRPVSYTDASILDLMELLCRAGLDVGLCLLPKTDLQQLLLLLLERIQEWPGKLQPLCCALSWVSDHHHNLLALVQFFLDVTPRGRQLRSQLSLVIIARMLGQQESLPFSAEKTQLALLSQLLSLMRPSSLRQCLGIETLPSSLGQHSKASAELDYKVCYLCHSLLTLAGVVVSSQDITPNQWGELQLLCMQLDRHISTHIRESPQAMHRTKLKDLATQTYIRWQDLLAHCQPQGQYFSPWKDI
ncbi:protein FAM178B isoform X3 [Mus musculus]|uniref:protein FAM178B isoform X3 n=1 Tax=Mus musculus TaxID=10090 RepID=UPI0003D6E7FF|nr:protein FAM178B isoform X3 [Mus musculus]|eukprot:XP_017176935.1 PREDICTED: protein FAM178B isoform X3 [Mus musculus]